MTTNQISYDFGSKADKLLRDLWIVFHVDSNTRVLEKLIALGTTLAPFVDDKGQLKVIRPSDGGETVVIIKNENASA